MRLNIVHNTKSKAAPKQSVQNKADSIFDCNTNLDFFSLTAKDIEHNNFMQGLTDSDIHFFHPLKRDLNITLENGMHNEVVCPANRTTIVEKYGLDITYNILYDTELIYYGINKKSFKNLKEKYKITIPQKIKNIDCQDLTQTEYAEDSTRIQELGLKLKQQQVRIEQQKDFVECYKEELKYIFLKHYFDFLNLSVLNSEEINLIKQLPSLVKSQINQPITSQCLCERLGLPPEKLKLGTEKVFQCSPKQLIDTTKIEHVVKDFKANGNDLVDAVYKNGLQSRTYFYQIFQEYYNTTPSSYFKM